MHLTCSEHTQTHTLCRRMPTVSLQWFYITAVMCFSSSLLITTSHTLLPGPPQRKLNAASSVWYPTPSKFVRFYCCWDTVVYFKHLAPEDTSEGHIFPLCFLTFSPFLFGSGLQFDFFLHHKMCPSGQQKLEQCNTVIHAFCLIIIIDVSQRELPII